MGSRYEEKNEAAHNKRDIKSKGDNEREMKVRRRKSSRKKMLRRNLSFNDSFRIAPSKIEVERDTEEKTTTRTVSVRKPSKRRSTSSNQSIHDSFDIVLKLQAQRLQQRVEAVGKGTEEKINTTTPKSNKKKILKRNHSCNDANEGNE